MSEIAGQHDGSLRVDWKIQARLALRRADPWAAWAEMRHAPPDEVEVANLREDLLKIVSKRILKTRDIELLGDLFRLAADAGALASGYSRGIKSAVATLSAIAADEAQPPHSVLAALYPIATGRNVDAYVLESMLDVFEVVAGRVTAGEAQEFMLALLSACRQRGYEGVPVRSLERMIELGETYA